MYSLTEILQLLISFFNSRLFLALQIVGGIISLFLFVASVWLILKAGYPQRHLRHLWAAWTAGQLPTHKLVRRWTTIEQALEDDQPNLWRRAIINADEMLSEIMARMGYLGKNFDERLETISPTNPAEFKSMLEAWRAHQVRKFIEEDKDYLPTREVAERTIAIYRNIFKETGILL